MFRREEKLLRQDVSDLESLAREDWIPTRYLPQPGEKRLRLNIGGQVYVKNVRKPRGRQSQHSCQPEADGRVTSLQNCRHDMSGSSKLR